MDMSAGDFLRYIIWDLEDLAIAGAAVSYLES